MSKSLFNPSCLAGLLQPYVDGEASPEQKLQVEEYLAQDPALKEMIQEQIEVRHTLTSLPSESAPSTLQARILLELDAVDREQTLTRGKTSADSRTGSISQLWPIIRSFIRRPMLAFPIGAAALVGLFLFTRPSTTTLSYAIEPTPVTFQALATPSALLSAPPPSVENLSPPSGVKFVRMGGQAYEHKGNTYFLSRDEAGRPIVFFEIDGIPHVLTLHDPHDLPSESASPLAIQRDYQELLNFGHLVKVRETGAVPESSQQPIAPNSPSIKPQFVSHSTP